MDTVTPTKTMSLSQFLDAVREGNAYLSIKGETMLNFQVPVIVEEFDRWNVYVDVYHVQQMYGGAEEGGWWWDLWQLEATICVRHRDLKEIMPIVERNYVNDPKKSYYSVNSSGEYRIIIELHKGSMVTKTRPHYE